MAQLEAFALQVWSPSMPRGYNLQSFHSDLKALMLKAGVEGQPVCLLLEDHQLVDPGFLECINSLLCGGEVHMHFLKSDSNGFAAQSFQQGFTKLCNENNVHQGQKEGTRLYRHQYSV